MEDIDLSDHKVTSEVHVFSEGEPIGDDRSIGTSQIIIRLNVFFKEGFVFKLLFVFLVISNFKFTLPTNYQRQNIAQGVSPCVNNMAVTDEDGDPIVHRRNHVADHSLAISMSLFRFF